MKKLTLILALALCATVALTQFIPKRIGLEPQNAKIVSATITSIDGDATYPIWIAPCKGYVATVPMFASQSGSAAADTSTTQNQAIYLLVLDSAGTAASDTIAYYTTQSATAANTMSASVRYRMTAVSANTSRIINTGDVVHLKNEETGSCTAISYAVVQFIFVPVRGQDYLPK